MDAIAPAPPGKATLTECHECGGTGARRNHRCDACHGDRYLIWHACPRCGDTAWQYINGVNDEQGMTCYDPRCGYRWDRNDPGWQAQRVPDTPRQQRGSTTSRRSPGDTRIVVTEGYEPPPWP